jgi:hypothetical protein
VDFIDSRGASAYTPALPTQSGETLMYAGRSTGRHSGIRPSPSSVGKLVLVYLLSGVAFFAGVFFTYLTVFAFDMDRAFESGVGERIFELLLFAGGSVIAAVMLYGLLKERLGLPLRSSHFWIISGVTWLATALAEISAGPMGLLAGDSDPVTVISVVAISVAIGLGTGLRLGRVTPTSEQRDTGSATKEPVRGHSLIPPALLALFGLVMLFTPISEVEGFGVWGLLVLPPVAGVVCLLKGRYGYGLLGFIPLAIILLGVLLDILPSWLGEIVFLGFFLFPLAIFVAPLSAVFAVLPTEPASLLARWSRSRAPDPENDEAATRFLVLYVLVWSLGLVAVTAAITPAVVWFVGAEPFAVLFREAG